MAASTASRSWLLVGALLPMVAIVAWAVTRDGTPSASSTPSSTVAPSPTTSQPPDTTAGGPAASESVAPSFALLEPIVSGGTAVLVLADGTFAFEVVGHGEETVQVLPEMVDGTGRYYRINYWREDGWTIEESGDGVDWSILTSVPDGVDNPGLIESDDGVVLVSYGYLEEPTPGELWEYWRWRDGEWLPLVGVPPDAGSGFGPIERLASGEELLVTNAEGPLSGLARGGYGCVGVQGVSTTEFGLSVNLVDTCNQFTSIGTLSLLGSGSDAVVALVDDADGAVQWRSPPGAGAAFDQLLALALAEGPNRVANADHIFFAGGEQRFWASENGIHFRLASALPVTPWAILPAFIHGEVVVIQPNISLDATRGEWRIGEPWSVRVLTSKDAREWVDASIETSLPVGESVGQMSVLATPDRVLVRVMDQSFVQVAGDWIELDDPGPWDWMQSLGDHFLGADWGQSTTLAISSDGIAWEPFDPTAVIEALDCGTDFTDWRVVGDELWFSTWDGRGVCIIRGRLEP